MNRIGLIIRCEHSHFIQVVMTEQEAKQLMIGWRENKLTEKIMGKCLTTGSEWIVKTDKIILIHTAEVIVTPQGVTNFPVPGSAIGRGSGFFPK